MKIINQVIILIIYTLFIESIYARYKKNIGNKIIKKYSIK